MSSRTVVALSRLADNVLPPSVAGFLAWGWYVSFFETAGYLKRSNYSNVYYGMHLVGANILLLYTAYLLGALLLLPRGHDIPPHAPPKSIQSRSIIFECANDAGDSATCSRGQCNGSWKPPRAHHCSICGVCRIGWDHHCPWLATCVTDGQLKTFIMLLLMASTSVVVLTTPVIAPCRNHASAALAASQSDHHTVEKWWNWWGSWIVAGGPVGRWAVGLYFGYQLLQNKTPPSTDKQLGHFIIKPRFGFFVFMSIAWAVAALSLALAATTALRVLAGESIVDTLKRRTLARLQPEDRSANQPLFWIPWRALDPDAVTPTSSHEAAEEPPLRQSGVAMRALPTERLYDLGRSQNWMKIWSGSPSDRTSVPEANADMIRRMKVHMFLKKWSPQ